MDENYTVVWLRNDLRLNDNPALFYADKYSKENNTKIICIYIFESFDSFSVNTGHAAKWWLHNSLEKLNAEMNKIYSNEDLNVFFKLNLYSGNPEKVILNLIKNYAINSIFWNRRYEYEAIIRDKNLKQKLVKNNIEVFSFNGKTLVEPWNIKGKQGQSLKVFTPYKNSLINNHEIKPPLPKPIDVRFTRTNDSLDLQDLNLKSKKWMKKFENYWNVGEIAALKKIDSFIKFNIDQYNNSRNELSINGTSKLSPHIHFGEISPTIIWHKICIKNYNDLNIGKKIFLSEIIWREFAINLMYLYPDLNTSNIKKQFDDFDWNEDKSIFNLWTKGKTGYPLIDAAMRELWETGWMHNRARMVVASFLTKHLLIPWQWGANWFHNTLLDSDFASNYASWQWVAGCGADAAPYFRIFNPITQSIKFDNKGVYIKKYVPELKNIDIKSIHDPDLILDVNYEKKIIDHKFARTRALNAYSKLKAHL